MNENINNHNIVSWDVCVICHVILLYIYYTYGFFDWHVIVTFSSLASASDSEQLSMFTVATPNDALGKTVVDGVVGLIRSNLSSLSLWNFKEKVKKEYHITCH